MNSILDYVGSIMVGGLVFVMMMSFYLNLGEAAASQTSHSLVQEDLASVVRTMDYDFAKVGYCVSDSIKVSRADSNRVTLRGYFDGDAALDSVQYYVANSPSSPTADPNAKLLYRVVDAVAKRASNNGVTNFKLRYYDASGSPTTVLKNIRSIQVAMCLQSNTQFDSVYVGSSWKRVYKGVYWERLFKPQNLR